MPSDSPCSAKNRLAGAAFAWLLGVVGVGAQTEYHGDGVPTAYEEEVRWLVNRARFDRAKENALRRTAYTDVPASLGPLAPNAKLMRAARNHCEDLARTGRFQHETVPGSRFYNRSLYPQPWDRMTAEGYDWDLAGENIAAGYTSALSVYVGWWKSVGHRRNLGNRHFCEIGNGYRYRAGSEYRYYQGMSMGRSWDKRFFTGTLFHDRNNNKAYSSGEGVAGVRVELTAGVGLHPDYDVSTGVGSFAVPLEGIAEGAVVQVRLTNTNSVAVQLTVPRSFDHYENITLEAGESVGWGGFTRVEALRNYGFRDATIPAAALGLAPGSRLHNAEGVGSASVVVSSPVPVTWLAKSEVGWLTITGSGAGQAGETLSYEVQANPFGEIRTGRILFEVEGQVQGTFLVRQEGVVPELSVAESSVDLGEDGGQATIEVGGNVTWVATTTAHWLRIEEAAGGLAEGLVKLKVANNAGSMARTGELTVEGAGIKCRVEVRQSAGAVRSVAEIVEIDVGEGAGHVISVSGLPAGLAWDAAAQKVTGQLSGAGTHRLRVRVRRDDGTISQHEVVVQVSPLAAPYVGRFEARVAAVPGHPAADLGGLARFTVTATGVATGTIDLAVGRRVFRGRLVAQPGTAPRLQLPIVGLGQHAAELDLIFAENHLVHGHLRSGGLEASVSGWRRLWHPQVHPIAEIRVGRSHVLMDVDETWSGDEQVPQGAGFLVVTVGSGGQARWVGRLGDGSSVTGTGFLGPASQWQGWQTRYARQGAFRWFGVWDNQMGLHCSGEWEKRGPSSAADRLYRGGFGNDHRGVIQVGIAGAKWDPNQMAEVLQVGAGTQHPAPPWVLKLAEGVLLDTASPMPTSPVQVQANPRAKFPVAVVPTNRERLALRFNPTTGMITGGFRLEDAHPFDSTRVIRRDVKFQGLWLSPDRFAGGYFVGVRLPETQGKLPPLVSGLVVLEPAPAGE